MELTSRTVKRGNSYKTEYRIDGVWVDTYTDVSSLIEELYVIVALFPEELRSKVFINIEEDSHYATFTAIGPASKEDTEKAMAKDAKDKQAWLDRAISQRNALNIEIDKVSREIK